MRMFFRKLNYWFQPKPISQQTWVKVNNNFIYYDTLICILHLKLRILHAIYYICLTQLRNWCPQCLGMLLSFLKVLIILSFKITQNFRSRLVLRLSKFVLCEYFGLQSVQHNPLKFRVYTIFWDFVILFLPREQRKPSY